ncbi:MAG: ABC transporter ATP-binding protein [Dehalococcoidia bacterium]|jgi:iron complex transport system ATP-binding protein|nr:ABC transporter ATP-binding protein [Dehalococcoidia bacterium]
MLRIDANKLTLVYGSNTVVRDISFAIESGCITGLVGPNGCGKSSIIKALSRVLAPQSGSISYNGLNTAQLSCRELACLLGVVPQIPLLPSNFTAFEVVLMGRNPHLGLFQYESSKDFEIVRRAMEQTRTQHLAERRIGELSGGEIQSVVIARVLAQQTQGILLDEPTSNLDIGRQTEVLDLMRDLCHRHGLMIGVVLHDLNLAVQYCDHMILLNQGSIVAEGAPSQVVTPENIRTVYGGGSAVYSIDGLPAVLPRAGSSV